MGYVTDSIQFRTESVTPLSHFASVFNHVRDVILSTGMEQVSLGDWPDQVGDVVTGVASDNDVSLDDITAERGYNQVGSWVFKHPSIDMYVRMEFGLLADYISPHTVRLPRFLFTCGQAINIGESEFSGSYVHTTPMRDWYTGNSSTPTANAWGVSRHPADMFILRSYCGPSGFWIYADGGIIPTSSTSLSNPLSKMSLLCAVFLMSNDPAYRVSLDSVKQTGSASSTGPGTGVRPLGSTAVGAIPHTYYSGTWREQLPGSLGLLDAPHILSTDKGIRVAQCQLYGAGAPIPLPLAMVQASFEEVPFRLDLDGSGERTWLPVPAYQAAQFFVDVAPPANYQNHCIYALPASDD